MQTLEAINKLMCNKSTGDRSPGVSSSKNNQLVQKQHTNKFQDHMNKCRCCLAHFDETKTRILITDFHREIFRSVIKVELRIDLRLSDYMCSKCDEKLKNLSELVQGMREKLTNFHELKENIVKEEILSCSGLESTDEQQHLDTSQAVIYDFYDKLEIEKEEILETQSESMIITEEYDVSNDNNRNYELAYNLKDCTVNIMRLDMSLVENRRVDVINSSTLKPLKPCQRKTTARLTSKRVTENYGNELSEFEIQGERKKHFLKLKSLKVNIVKI